MEFSYDISASSNSGVRRDAYTPKEGQPFKVGGLEFWVSRGGSRRQRARDERSWKLGREPRMREHGLTRFLIIRQKALAA
jgi:hypothetical protein